MIGRLLPAMCIVCLCVGFADAASVGKVQDVIPNELENANADAVATLVWHPDKDFPALGDAQITVVITGFQPNATYRIHFTSSGFNGDIETNPAGNGSLHVSLPFIDDPVAGFLWIYLDDEVPGWQDEPGAVGIVE